MSRTAKGTSIEKIIAQFERVDFDEKMKIFHEIRDYISAEVEKNLTETKYKITELEKYQASISQ